jgi:two-component system sensor histidine kinase TctE
MSDPTRPSLRRQLLIWLLLPQLVLWAGGGLLTYRIALSYAEKGIDQSLTQSVRALARQVKPVGSGLLIDFPRAAQDVLEQDPDDRISYMVASPPGQFLLGNQRLPQPTEAPGGPGEPLLYGGLLDGTPLRIVAMDVRYGEGATPQTLRVQVGKGLAVQQRIAGELVADMLAPLLALGVLLSLLVYGGIRRGLAPLTRLTAQLEHRSVNALSPIGMTQAPRAVHALVQAVNGLLDEVARSVNQEKRFINDAAHQLRTPLAGLISQVELAQRETGDPVLSQRLAKVLTGAQRSAHLVHQLLTLARTETRARSEPLDLPVLAREVAREWTPRALAAGMDLGYEGADHLVMNGDTLQLREAMANLIDNALRYAGADEALDITVDTGEGFARIEVADRGPGIPEAEVERMRQPFTRLEKARTNTKGAGLGLAIVKHIALIHKGTVGVESQMGKGAVFTIRLPTDGC